MKVLPAAKFKEQCLALLDEVDPEGILVTKRGKPVAKLIPVERGGGALLGRLKGKIHVKGDLLSTGVWCRC
ncbi:MAG TPA: type II toxin-antitoxin system Phd/YefM family antitoxin [Myxococcaceae bacterium]|jgi:prevent-host-death family protein